MMPPLATARVDGFDGNGNALAGTYREVAESALSHEDRIVEIAVENYRVARRFPHLVALTEWSPVRLLHSNGETAFDPFSRGHLNPEAWIR